MRDVLIDVPNEFAIDLLTHFTRGDVEYRLLLPVVWRKELRCRANRLIRPARYNAFGRHCS
jgi:hypothetical protein